MINRILCRVPGCRRGMNAETAIKRFGTTNVSLICRDHWRRLTAAERRLWARLRRIERRYGIEAVAGRMDRIWPALIRRSGS